MSGSGISWAICKSAPRSRQITTPVPHHCFLQAGCPSCSPTNSVKALKDSMSIHLVHKNPTSAMQNTLVLQASSSCSIFTSTSTAAAAGGLFRSRSSSSSRVISFLIRLFSRSNTDFSELNFSRIVHSWAFSACIFSS